jgi:hypothetical protein
MDHAEKMAFVGFLSGLDKSAFPRIIGTKGANVSRLRDETGADINVSKEDDVITIAGLFSSFDVSYHVRSCSCLCRNAIRY